MSENNIPEDRPEALEWHVWVARYDDARRKDHLVFGDSDSLEDHAPAIAHGRSGDVEHLGTFKDFEAKRETIDLDLPKRMGAPGDLTGSVGRERFWDAVRGDHSE